LHRRSGGISSRRAPLALVEALESRTHLSVTPNDPNFSSQWYLQNTTTPGNDINAPAAWNVTTGSNNVVIAVLDSGINITDPDLQNNIWTNPGIVTPGISNDIHGWNFLTNSNNVTDNSGHGTAAATIIGAQGNNGIGNTGVDWHVSLLPVVVGDSSGVTDQNLINGINYVIGLKQRGVNIVAINASYLSFGFPGTAALSAIQNAGNNGILYVAAAGNSSMNLDTIIPSGFLPSNMLMVAATDNQNNLASFSNYGANSVAVGAPGDNVLTSYDGFYVPLSGTSFAAPMVSGIVGLMAAADPSATMSQLENAILDSGVADPSLAGKTITGKRVDAYSALQALLGSNPVAQSHLAFTTQPSSTTTGTTVGPAITIAIEDASGNVVTTDSSNVTLAIATGPSGASIFGTTTVAAINGIATFSGLSFTSAGTYTLSASDGSLAAATSNAFFVGDAKNETLVNTLYHQLLNRDAEPSFTGLYYWTNRLDNGDPLSNVADGIATSTEYDTDVVNGIYEQYLHRAADPTGVANWVGQMQSGTVSYETIRGYILGSQEFQNDLAAEYPDYVTGLYETLLGRAPDAAGLAYWTQMLGTLTSNSPDTQRDPVAIGISTSFEQYEDFVTAKFQQFLNRAPSAALTPSLPSPAYQSATNPNGIPTPTSPSLQGEQGYWADSLSHGTTDGDFIADILSSNEYLQDQGLLTS
jgi:subtilisin family serine protease